MTRQPHDQFAKQYLSELLAPLGTVEISREVTDEVRQIDLYFAPSPTPPTEPPNLGLLSQLVSNPCLIEPFRNQPSKTEIRTCLLKLLSLQSDLQRQARRENRSLPETELPRLWILATSASITLLDSFSAKLEPKNWSQGVYFLPEALKTAIIAINQLPVTQETLWLRILGKGTTQQQAISELLALPKEHPLRSNTLELIYSWRITLENKENLDEDERELIMNLSEAYIQWREETLLQGLRQGLQQGTLQGQRLVLESLFKVRFGNLDEELLAVITALLKLPPEEFTRLTLQLTREELVAQFSKTEN
ncbi:MAG TPA: hypothetical protein DCL61_33040 [Cyanobacteria bacterium UBA12227]|nr:hypothetical protein [Cyanobacteria bacterium UBA12227]HAX87971.1 hypothetical protein [Cyanobacteria bacterium UBA11370]